jgi:hypothetical protein
MLGLGIDFGLEIDFRFGIVFITFACIDFGKDIAQAYSHF